MDKDSSPLVLRPIVGDDALVGRLRELHQATWPAGLHRFGQFTLEGEDSGTAHVAVAWDPGSKVTCAQKIKLNGRPPRCQMPKPILVNAEWIARVRPIPKAVRPDYMNQPLAEVPPSTLAGLSRRKMLIFALIMVDPLGNAYESDYIVNDWIFFDPRLRNSRIEELRQLLMVGPGFRPFMLKLLTKFLWYGGDEHALLSRTPDQGGPDEERLAPAGKPGPLSLREKLAKASAEAKGKDYVRSGRRFDHTDKKYMTEGLTVDWAGEDKLSLEATRININADHYGGRPASERVTARKIQYRYKKIAQEKDLLKKRHGPHSTRQNLTPRPGTSSELTQGALEILDVDGFKPKAVIGGLVNGKLVPITVWIIFAVSRLSGAIRGYEICLEGERAEGYLHCLISALLPLDDHIASLGLDPLPGVLTGNFDGAFVDNGAGKSAKVSGPMTQSLGGVMFYPPGQRPDLKAVVERFNGIMIKIMAERTKQGYTRAHNPLDEVKRKERLKSTPMTIRELEILILQTIDEFNRTTDRSHLRSAEMREAGCGISPAEIHRYHQRYTRAGEAARVRPADEVFDIFLPWKPVTCESGRVKYKHARYSSNALVALSEAHAMLPGKNDSLTVEVKRTSRYSSKLLCRGLDRKVFDINMIEEDKWRFHDPKKGFRDPGKGSHDLTWKEMEIACLDDTIEQQNLEDQRIKDAVKRRKKSNGLHVRQQDIVDDAEKARGNVYANVVGATKTQATRSGAAAREAKLAANQRASYGLPPEVETVPETDPPQWETVEDDDPLAQAARLIENQHRSKK
ncbi:hypothetical protein [Paraburkholderia sp. 22B1P]|uniref:hypothetical protein n=1 Tax=Paraburkholderia sp. 22B1P TaxID=3080498 RepID=UPI0030884872|nr:hypothetical protein PBP221_77210 [Paraburkholderia sp. 22B1P]